jgi:lycopene beta-cyclase
MNENWKSRSSNPLNPKNLRLISGGAVEHYDYIIAGGGLSGLSLAYHLAHSSLGDKKMLIVDQSPKRQNDRTWGFWSDRTTPFESIVDRSWSRLRFVSPGLERIAELGAYRYNVIRGLDFYKFVREDLAARDNITFKRGRVRQIEDGPYEAQVLIDDQTVSAKWVFDSCYGRADVQTYPSRYHHLKLHFAGWEIRTDKSSFDPEVATLMDFRASQEGETRFFYLLPFDERQALVEYTIFSKAVLGHGDYDYVGALRGYIKEQLGIETYEIVRREKGCIPISDQPFPRRLGRRVMSIGARGGRIKPTTGYAFSRIHADSAAIIDSLLRTGRPFDVPADPYRYRLCDSILLDVMEERGEEVRPIFEAMFANNSIGRIFRFLDEAAPPWEHLAIIPTLPPRPFLRALLHRRVWAARSGVSGSSGRLWPRMGRHRITQ